MGDLWYFYCGGRRVIELIVALHSLRKHYKGRIGIALDPISQSIIPPMPEDIEIAILPTAATHGYDHMSQRWAGLKLFKYDRVITCDIDTIIAKPVQSCFDTISPKHDHLTTYSGYNITPADQFRFRQLFKQLEPSCPDNDYIYVTMGLFGININYPHIDEMIRICPSFGGRRCMAEEYAISFISQLNGHKVYWPRDRLYITRTRVWQADPVVWHAIRNRYTISGQWRREWYECKNENFMGMGNPDISDRLEPGISTWPNLS